MKEKNSFFERILQIIDYKKIKSVNEFAIKYLNYEAPQKINRLKEDGKNPSYEIILDIVNKFEEINPEWLLTGRGEMLKSPVKEVQEVALKEPSEAHLIPLYDGVMTASVVSQELPAQAEATEMVNAGDWFRDATAAMRVHGDSMYPDYVSGSIVAMKEVHDKRLVVFGQDYMIETSEYRILKRLQKSDDKQCYLLCSTNTEVWEAGALKGRLIHEPFDIHLDSIVRLYQILGVVKRNHSSRVVQV